MITHDRATIHQQARTYLINFYGKYFNKQMYAELWNYVCNVEKQQETLQAELNDYKHNYKVLNEFNDNSVAYGVKIQNELNILKKDVARYFELKKAFDTYTNNNGETISEFHERWDLEDKLSKVGKEK